MRRLLGADAWDGLYTFSVVRNPWDRVWSLYRYRRKRESIPAAWTFDQYVHRLATAQADTVHFGHHAHRLGMCEMLCDVDGALLVDTIIRFEERAAGLSTVSERLGLPELGALRVQGSDREDTSYRSAYSLQSRSIVAERFRRDIELFGYDF